MAVKYTCDTCLEDIEGTVFRFVKCASCNSAPAISGIGKNWIYMSADMHFCSPKCLAKNVRHTLAS